MNKKILLGITILLGALFILGCVPKETRTALIELGPWNHPKQNPDIERVRGNLKEAQGLYPNDPTVYHLWGRVYAMDKNYVEMNKAFAKCDSLSTQYKAANDTLRMYEWDALYKSGRASYDNQDYEATIKAMQDAIICWPKQYEPYLFSADAAYRMGANIEANKEDIDSTKANDGEEAEKAGNEIPDSTRARIYYEKAYEFSKAGYVAFPDSVKIAHFYADMSLVNNKFDEAKDTFIKLKNDDPTNPSYLFNIGEIYLAEGDTLKALENYEAGLQVDNTYAEGYLNISKLYFLIRDYNKSEAAFEHYMTLATPLPDDYFLYLLSLYQNNKFDKCKEETIKFTAAHPDYCDGWQLLANVYVHTKMSAEAMDATKKYDACLGK